MTKTKQETVNPMISELEPPLHQRIAESKNKTGDRLKEIAERHWRSRSQRMLANPRRALAEKMGEESDKVLKDSLEKRPQQQRWSVR
jgi:hypothetical protein